MQRSRYLLLLSGLVVAMLSLAACSGSARSSSTPTTSPAAGSTGGPTIIIKNFAYSPSTLTVAPGATVTVENKDSAPHTVSAASPHTGLFNTGDIKPGSTVTFTAPKTAGTYPYICEIHEFMHGTLVVR